MFAPSRLLSNAFYGYLNFAMLSAAGLSTFVVLELVSLSASGFYPLHSKFATLFFFFSALLYFLQSSFSFFPLIFYTSLMLNMSKLDIVKVIQLSTVCFFFLKFFLL